jgi:hypothetical protein
LFFFFFFDVEWRTINIQMKSVLLVKAGEMLAEIHMRAAQDGS